MKKNLKIALMIFVTVMQAVAFILSFIPEWCANYEGVNRYYNLYDGSSEFAVGVVYAICAIAIVVLMWTGFKKVNLVVSVFQAVIIIINHITVESYWSVLELGMGHTLLILASCAIVAILCFVKEKE